MVFGDRGRVGGAVQPKEREDRMEFVDIEDRQHWGAQFVHYKLGAGESKGMCVLIEM